MYHWDADTSVLPVTFGTQGVLYLTDMTDNQGSLLSWPGSHKSIIYPAQIVLIPVPVVTLLVRHRAQPLAKPRLVQ